MCRTWAHLLALTALLVFSSGPGWAGDVARGAELARQAHVQADVEALRRVARSQHGDVWVVIEQLLADDDRDVAEAVVSAGSRHAKRLAAYLVWRRAHPLEKGTPEQLDRIEAQRKRGNRRGAQALLAAGGSDARGVCGVRRGILQAFLLPEPERALAACVGAAKEANAIGWRTGELTALGSCVELSHRIQQHAQVLASGAALLAMLGQTGQRTTRYHVHRRMSDAARTLGRRAEAVRHTRRVVELAAASGQRRDALRHLLILDSENPDWEEVRKTQLRLRALEAELGNPHGVAATDAQLAQVETSLGRWSSALERMERALSFFERHGRPFERRGVHSSAAVVALGMLDGKRALQHVAAARTAGKGLGLGLKDDGLHATEAAALVLLRDYEAAEKVFAALLTDTSNMTPRNQAGTWMNLAMVQSLAGHHEAADKSLASARRAAGHDGGPDLRARLLATESLAWLRRGRFQEALRSAESARTLVGPLLLPRLESLIETRIAEAYVGRGEWSRALVHANRAVGLILQRSAALPARVGAHYRSKLKGTFALAIDAAWRGGDLASLFAHSERGRAVALRNRLGGRGAALELLTPELRAAELRLRSEEARAVRRYQIAYRAGEKHEAQRALVALGVVRERLDRHREHMHAAHATAAQLLDPRVDRLEDTQAALAPGEGQVHYVRGSEGVVALVVTRAAVRLVPLGSSASLEALLSGIVLEDSTSAWEQDLAKLKARIVDPLDLPKDIARVAIIPTGRLEVVPFAALLPDRDVTLVPSATVARLLLERTTQPGRGVLAVGNPADAEGGRLPGAGREVERVGDKRLVGKEASEQALRAVLGERPRWRAVHLACHALIDTQHPMRTSLALAPGGSDDGFWRLSEILGARVPADLVVLAACSSAQGSAFEQEGRLGFVHAFFVAGAKRVLASLWDIDDRAAERFMTRFYAALDKGEAPATALRHAQSWMRGQPAWRHPAHWVGWQLWGPHVPR